MGGKSKKKSLSNGSSFKLNLNGNMTTLPSGRRVDIWTREGTRAFLQESPKIDHVTHIVQEIQNIDRTNRLNFDNMERVRLLYQYIDSLAGFVEPELLLGGSYDEGTETACQGLYLGPNGHSGQ